MRTKTSKRNVLLACCLVAVSGVALAHEWMAPKHEATRSNPVAMDAESLARGETIYLERCASCHGESIEGLSASETGLSKDAPDLRKRLLTHADGDFFWKITTGRDDMPSFKDELSEDQIWEVIHFIRHSAQ